MTDLDAILRAVLADPHDDTPRLVYADVLDDLAGVVACPACGGIGWTTREKAGGSYAAESPWLIPDFATVGCPRCGGARDRRGSGSVSNGLAERAEFVRVHVELARMVPPMGLDRSAPVGLFGERERRFHKWGKGSAWGRRRESLEKRAADLWLSLGPGAFHDGTGFSARICVPFGEHRQPYGLVCRGFVSEIRTGLSQFVGGGGECGRCGGNGLLERHRGPGPGGASPMYDDCIPCSGTGRVGLDLAAVFAAHPITRVATDREPTAASHPSGAWHWTWAGNDADSRVGLPRKLMAALSASGIARVFDSRDAAMDGLSLACVNLGRAAAGLDPLT